MKGFEIILHPGHPPIVRGRAALLEESHEHRYTFVLDQVLAESIIKRMKEELRAFYEAERDDRFEVLNAFRARWGILV